MQTVKILTIAWCACSPKRRNLKQLQALALASAEAGGEGVASSPAAKGPAASAKAATAGKTSAKVSDDFFSMHHALVPDYRCYALLVSCAKWLGCINLKPLNSFLRSNLSWLGISLPHSCMKNMERGQAGILAFYVSGVPGSYLHKMPLHIQYTYTCHAGWERCRYYTREQPCLCSLPMAPCPSSFEHTGIRAEAAQDVAIAMPTCSPPPPFPPLP